jgi:dTDP-4-dehydrorhamnose reductase
MLVTGGSGYLGCRLAIKAAETYNLFTTYRTQPDRVGAGRPVPLDLTDRSAVLRLITDLQPEIIIHTAAVNPGKKIEAMMPVNASGSRHLAEAAVEVGARLVHVSTDVVHSGKQAPYGDDAAPTPLNEYGRSKAAAEAAVAQVDPTAAIVRTSLIYGLDEIDRGTEGFIERLETKQPLVLFSDVIRQPVWVDSLAAALLKLSDVAYGGLLNVVGQQALTREEFGRKMLDWWQADTGDLLEAGRAAEISDMIPLDLRMVTGRAEQLLDMNFPGVDDVLSAAASR